MEANREAVPEVSVVVPVYDTPRDKFAACLSSIMSQEGVAMECIVVDDGSRAPHIAPMLASATAADNRLRVVRKANGGPSSARNTALSEARGRYVTFVDADDTLAPGALAMMVETAVRTRADIAIFAFGSSLALRPGQEAHDRKARVVEGGELRRLVADTVGGSDTGEDYGVSLATVWARLFRRELLTEANLRFREDIHIGEDLLFCACAAQAARRVAIDPRPVYIYAYDAASITHTPSPRYRLTARRLVVALAAFVEQWHPGERDFEAALNRRVFPFAEVYASARFAQSRSEGKGLGACRREMAEWMSHPLVSRSAAAVTAADLRAVGYATLRNALKLWLFRHRLATPYLLLMLAQEKLGKR